MSAAADFDFLRGRWTIVHRRLRDRSAGSNDWVQSEGSAENRPLLSGAANVEEHVIPGEDFGGIALRTFSPVDDLWSIYWVSHSDGLLGPPVRGRFSADLGIFEGQDQDGSIAVMVRFLWRRIDPMRAQWTQYFSYDGGEHWEKNWIMDFRRDGGR